MDAARGRLPTPAPCFEDSRRQTGPNLYFARPGVVLETLGAPARDADAHARWRANVLRACDALAWPAPSLCVRIHASGAALAFTAPEDRLLAATEVNEWAWCAAVGDRSFHAPGFPLAGDDSRAFDTLHRAAAAEANPALLALLAAAESRDVPALLDDEAFTLGLGAHGRTWPLDALPAVEAVPWDALGRVPTALVTGSNGKTTTTRLLAAMLRAHGLRTAHSCTDGLLIGRAPPLEVLESGDYSGPGGARQLLRRDDVQAAVLETARGGILRRGLALRRADVAVVTNISADHFGEYGIHSLDDLAGVKLTVARAVADRGWLVLNAADPLLRAHGAQAASRVAWFDADAHDARRDGQGAVSGGTASPDAATADRAAGAPTPRCTRLGGRLWLCIGDGSTHDLGAVADMPLTLGGTAGYNIANAAAAALAAHLLGVSVDTIADTLVVFGRDHADNPGRLQRWRYGGLRVYLDYAHNPDGLDGLLAIVAGAHRDGTAQGRLALILGQAGNRGDAEIRDLAAAAAAYRPDLVLLKDIDGYMRGRAVGEVAALIADELQRGGLPPDAIRPCLREQDAARELLQWAREGDTLVMPLHGYAARDEVAALLDGLEAGGWRPGQGLPPVG